MILINIGAMVVLYLAYTISRKTRGELNVKDFRKVISGVCPGWLSIMTGLLIMYALGGLILSIFKRYSDSSVITNWQGIMAHSGYLMALYSLALSIVYCCKRLKKLPGKKRLQ
jgi:hypothetical protein